MVKTLLKNICVVLALHICVVLTIFLMRIEDQSIRPFSVIGLITLVCTFSRICSYIGIYYKYKNEYLLIKKASTIRRNLEGNCKEVNEYTEWIKNIGNDMLEKGQVLLKSYLWLPKKNLIRINKDVLSMMEYKYPPN